MSLVIFALAVLSPSKYRTLDVQQSDIAPASTVKSGWFDASVVSFGIVLVVIAALCFGAYTYFKQRASREVQQAEEPLLVVED
jgi:heme/copper-type cytochrome/quinol oxidase subunit 2